MGHLCVLVRKWSLGAIKGGEESNLCMNAPPQKGCIMSEVCVYVCVCVFVGSLGCEKRKHCVPGRILWELWPAYGAVLWLWSEQQKGVAVGSRPKAEGSSLQEHWDEITFLKQLIWREGGKLLLIYVL